MLPSEFFERTHITLTAEEYADVECLYNAVKMDKDEFCKRWVSEKKNPLFKELAEAYLNEVSHHRADVTSLTSTSKELRKELNECKENKIREIDEVIDIHNAAHNEFAKKLILTGCDDAKVYDTIEEEFGIGFIIRTKRENGIPLSDAEIDYMVGKL